MDANAAERRAAASTEADNAEAAEQAAAYIDSLKRGPSVASDAPGAEGEGVTRKRGNREIIVEARTGDKFKYMVPLSKHILVQDNQ